MMFRSVALVVVSFAAVACATPQPAAPSQAQLRAARLAALVTGTADAAPERVLAAEAEMAALERALQPVAVAEAQAGQVPAEQAAIIGPAPDLSGARSIMSAVHLASYRQREHADSGWTQLRAAAPDLLSGLEPRLSEVDLGERGLFMRLKAGPLDSPEAASRLCAALESAGHWCVPTDFSGAPLALSP